MHKPSACYVATMEERFLALLLQLVLLMVFSINFGKGQTESDVSRASGSSNSASVIGFAVVVSILVIAVVIVIMVCVIYGICKTPCKPRGRDSSSGRSERHFRSMIPLPSPRTVQPSTSSSNPLQVQQNQAFSASNGRLRSTNQTQSGPFSPEIFSAPPTSTNVVNLSQLQSLSFHSGLHHALDTAIEQGVISTSPPQNDSGHPSLLPAPPPQQQRPQRTSNQSYSANQPPSHMKPRMVRPPPPYPGIGYPYQPCKSTKASSGNNSAHAATQQNVLQHLRELPPPGASGLYARRQAKKSKNSQGQIFRVLEDDKKQEQDSVAGNCSSSSVQNNTDRSSPPSYCTEI